MSFLENILGLEEKILKGMQSGREFPALVAESIESFSWSSFKRQQILTFLQKEIPRQHYGPYGFGKFNLTLRWNDEFSIQLYFMDEIATEIHTHIFQGYFYYLEGRVLETVYERKLGTELAPGILKDGIALVQEKLLHPFEGRPIVPGPIHQVLRLDPVSTVLMIMKHRPLEPREELILPSGHVITGTRPSDHFLRLVTLLEATPELKSEIIPLLSPVDMALYCFRNGDISSLQRPGVQVILEALGQYLPVEEVLRAYEQQYKKALKFQKLGALP